jgi:DNA-binding response OmpR family regulator
MDMVIADDDETIRSILQHKFSAEKYQLSICEDGGEAREQLNQADIEPDLVMLDVMMPRVEGTQLLREIRRGELAVRSDVPVIILTSRGREDHVLEGFESGADKYLTKPFSPNELVIRVQNVLNS